MNFKAKKVMKQTKIFYWENFGKRMNDGIGMKRDKPVMMISSTYTRIYVSEVGVCCMKRDGSA